MVQTARRRIGVLSFWRRVCNRTAWLIWSRNMVRSHENYLSRLNAENILANTDRLGSILRAIAGQSVQWQQWGGLWEAPGPGSHLGLSSLWPATCHGHVDPPRNASGPIRSHLPDYPLGPVGSSFLQPGSPSSPLHPGLWYFSSATTGRNPIISVKGPIPLHKRAIVP